MSIAIAHRESPSLRGKPWRQGLGDTKSWLATPTNLMYLEQLGPTGRKSADIFEELEAMGFTGLMRLAGKKDAQK